MCMVCVLYQVSYGQTEDYSQEKLIIREGKQFKKNAVAVEGYLIGDIFEVKVEARMHAERPKIHSVFLKGAGIGRLSYTTREDVPVSIEEEDPYEVNTKRTMLSRKKTKVKRLKGAVTKELFKFKLPTDKFVAGKPYQLWVEIISKTRGGGAPQKFKFDLEGIYQALSQ